MKQTYSTPTLVQSGNLLGTTLSGFQPGTEIGQQSLKKVGALGNMGFYL